MGWNMKKVLVLGMVLTVFGCLFTGAGCKKAQGVSVDYDITAEYIPENKTLTGTAKVTFENETDTALSVLKFQTYPNAYRQNALYKPVSTAYADAAYYQGESYGEMVISSVHGSKNWEIMGDDENILCVYLERELYPGDKVVLDIGFLTKLAQVNHRTGITQHTVNLGNFYPVLCGWQDGDFYESVYYSDGDPFLSECADYSVQITLPKEYFAAASSAIVGERMLESKKVYTFSAERIRDFALVLSTKYRTLSAKAGDTELLYYYYADEAPKKTLECAVEAFTFFEETFGEYPYSSYTVAETGFCFGGMEYPGLTMLSDSLKGEDRARAIAHETAHQWWYAAVGSDQIHNAWQDEGLAEYSAICFFESSEKYSLQREKLVTEALKEYRSYYDIYGSVLGRTDTRMTRSLAEYVSDYEYRCLAYDKPVVMFDTLRKSIGDKKFFAGLERYYRDCIYTLASVGDLVGAFEKSGVDAAGFFEGFLEGKAIL